MFCYLDVLLQETFFYGDVLCIDFLYGDVLSRRRLVPVCAPVSCLL
jgi:hypothetical protein